MFKFESNAKEVKEAIRKASQKGVLEACLLVEAQAKTLATVDTGQLRDSITHRVEDEAGELVGEVGTPTEYAPYIEYGTMYQKAQPFLLPAFRENKSNIEKLIGEILGSEVGR